MSSRVRSGVRIGVMTALLFGAVWWGVALGQQPAQPASAPAPAADGQAAEPTVVQAPKMTMLELFMRGGPFMIPIGICSLAGLAVIIERVLALRQKKIIPPRFLDGLRATFRGGADEREAGLHYCRSQNNPVARVLAAGIGKLHRGEEAVEQAIEDAGANEVAKLRRNLRLLYGISAVAPMLGLLGTVSGMITAFQITSVIVGPEKSLQLAKGIYEALVTTYAGLLVAIPVLIAYYYFQGKIERLVAVMNDMSMEFVEHYAADTTRAAAAARDI